MATVVKENIQNALVEVTSLHDWEALQRKTDLTYNEDPLCIGEIELDEDVDRILILRPQDTTYPPLDKIPAALFEEYQTRYVEPSKPRWYTYVAPDHSVDTAIPILKIKLWPTPADGDVFPMWYIEHIAEITDWDKVPKLPSHLWHLVALRTMAIMVTRMDMGKNAILQANTDYEAYLARMLVREEYGDDSPKEIRQSMTVSSWYKRRRQSL